MVINCMCHFLDVVLSTATTFCSVIIVKNQAIIPKTALKKKIFQRACTVVALTSQKSVLTKVKHAVQIAKTQRMLNGSPMHVLTMLQV